MNKQQLMEQYLQKMNINIRKPFRCLNPEHEDVHPSMSYNKKTGYVHCFSCGANYDIYNLVEIIDGIQGFYNQMEYVAAGFKQVPGTIQAMDLAFQDNEPRHEKLLTLPTYLWECHQNLSQKAIDYLQSRGLTLKTIQENQIGEDPNYLIGAQPVDMITIPYGKDLQYYLARSIEGKAFAKPSGIEEMIFHQDAFDNESVIITESPICALSIEQETGRRCAALSGLGYHRIVEYLVRTNKKPFILLCLDNDDKGTQALLSFQKELQKIGVESVDARGGNPYKDPNEYLINLPEEFKEWCKNLPERPTNNHKLSHILQTWDQRKPEIFFKTGWTQLDSSMKFRSGIYVLGGISSAGKTTWMLQTAWKMSEFHRVFYCSLEQTENTLAEILLRGHSKEELMDDSRDLSLYFVDGYEKILDLLMSNKESVIIIDYLQLLATGQGVKGKIDDVLKDIKQLALKNENLVWLVSSLNRSNYYRTLDFESFKESGGIEYSAEGVLGIQYKVVHNKAFGTDNNAQEKRNLLNLEKRKNPRRMEIVCLKDKYGAGVYEGSLDFFTDKGIFVEKKETAKEVKVKRI